MLARFGLFWMVFTIRFVRCSERWHGGSVLCECSMVMISVLHLMDGLLSANAYLCSSACSSCFLVSTAWADSYGCRGRDLDECCRHGKWSTGVRLVNPRKSTKDVVALYSSAPSSTAGGLVRGYWDGRAIGSHHCHWRTWYQSGTPRIPGIRQIWKHYQRTSNKI